MRDFLRARLDREHWLGLHLTVGLSVALACMAVFAVIASQVVSGGALVALDQRIAQRMFLGGDPALASMALLFAAIHGTAGMLALSAVLATWLAWRRGWWWAAATVLCVQGAMLLNVLVKQVFQRERPRFDNPLAVLDSFSFPSGHTAAATAFYGLLAVLLVAQAGGWLRKMAVALPCLAMVVLVSWTRLALGVHWFSDVLAAFAQSAAWLALCLAGIASWRLRRGARS